MSIDIAFVVNLLSTVIQMMRFNGYQVDTYLSVCTLHSYVALLFRISKILTGGMWRTKPRL